MGKSKPRSVIITKIFELAQKTDYYKLDVDGTGKTLEFRIQSSPRCYEFFKIYKSINKINIYGGLDAEDKVKKDKLIEILKTLIYTCGERDT